MYIQINQQVDRLPLKMPAERKQTNYKNRTKRQSSKLPIKVSKPIGSPIEVKEKKGLQSRRANSKMSKTIN